MAMTGKDYALISVSAIAAILLSLNVSQCEGNQDAKNARAADKAKIENLQRGIDSVRNNVRVLDSLARVKSDSLDATVKKLAECEAEKNKRCPVKKPAKKPVVKKPVAKPEKPREVPVQCDTPIVIDQVPVYKSVTVPAAAPQSQQVIVNGDNNGNIIINNGGTVNNYNVPAEKSQVVIDTLRRVCQIQVSVESRLTVKEY